MGFFQLVAINKPGISDSYLLDLVVERVLEGLLQTDQAISSRCEHHEEYFLEARIFDEIIPNMVGMLTHIGERSILTFILLSRVHDKDAKIFLVDSPVNLWKHGSNLKVAENAWRLAPNTGLSSVTDLTRRNDD